MDKKTDKSYKVLIVDDIPENLQVISNMLDDKDIDISFAVNGKQALEVVEYSPPDLILLDIAMPEMDGYEVCKQLKENPKTSPIPVIFLTAKAQSEDIVKGLQLGAVDYVTKPFNNQELLTRLFSHLELKKSRDLINEQNVLLEELNQEKDQALYELETQAEKLRKEIEERKAAEKALKASELRLINTQNIAKIGNCIYNYDTKNVDFSDNFFDVLGLPYNTLKDNNYHEWIFQYIHPDEKTAAENFLKQQRGKHEDFEKTLKFLTPDQETKHFLLSASFQKEGGKTKQLLFIVQDVSEQMKSEELKKAVEIAEKSAEIKQQLLSNLSHEIRTPMNGMLGMLEFLRGTKLDEKQSDYLETIESSSKSLMKLINDVLDISRIDAGKMKIKPQDFDLKKTLHRIKMLFEPTAKQKNIDFSIDLGENLPGFIHTDENRLSQIVTNLVSNALKFTEKGKVDIIAALEKSKSGEPLIKIGVKDTGIGISKEDQKSIFGIFTQLDTSSTRDTDGAGLGLAISRELVEMMDGDIQVESEKGKGSHFWFIIPAKVAKEKQGTKKTEKKAEKKTQSLNKKVLYVEDKFVNQKIVSMMLENADCQVDTAENGQIALDMFEEGKYDFILMDIQMPVMDGVEAMKQLRERYADLPPIVALSANALTGDAEKYIGLGMDDYLAKPVNMDQLVNKVAHWTGAGDTNTATEETKIVEAKKELINNQVFKNILDQTAGDKDVVKNLYDSFTCDAEEAINKIEEAKEQNSSELLHKSLVSLRGLCGTVGADALFDLSRKLHELTQSGETTSAFEYLDQLKKTYTDTEKVISEKLKNI